MALELFRIMKPGGVCLLTQTIVMINRPLQALASLNVEIAALCPTGMSGSSLNRIWRKGYRYLHLSLLIAPPWEKLNSDDDDDAQNICLEHVADYFQEYLDN